MSSDLPPYPPDSEDDEDDDDLEREGDPDEDDDEDEEEEEDEETWWVSLPFDPHCTQSDPRCTQRWDAGLTSGQELPTLGAISSSS